VIDNPSEARFGSRRWSGQGTPSVRSTSGTGNILNPPALTNASPLQVGGDIRNISGATLSSHHVAEGVKRIMAIANRLR
jgi:hypothetical protein